MDTGKVVVQQRFNMIRKSQAIEENLVELLQEHFSCHFSYVFSSPNVVWRPERLIIIQNSRPKTTSCVVRTVQ